MNFPFLFSSLVVTAAAIGGDLSLPASQGAAGKAESRTPGFCFSGYFSGLKGEFPHGWIHYAAKEKTESGLTDEFGFEKSPLVMRLAAGKHAECMQKEHRRFPNSGRLEFSVWARSAEKPSTLTVHLIGDQYEWRVTERFKVGKAWQRFRIEGKVPERYKHNPQFWPRIDAEPGSDLLIGKTELKHIGAREQNRQEETSVVNADFSFGSWMWDNYLHDLTRDGMKNFNRSLPVFQNDTVTLEPGNFFTSFCFPMQTKTPYTATLRMKNGIPGKNAAVNVFIIDGKWSMFQKKFTLADQWRDYSFTGQLLPNKIGYSYLRIDPLNAPVSIDRVQVRKGTDSAMLPPPPVSFGFFGANNFDVDRKDAVLNLRVKMQPEVKVPVKINMEIFDGFGKPVRKESFDFPVAADQTRQIGIDTSRRGVYTVRLTSGKQNADFRYAVLKDLRNMDLPDNPLAGHHSLFQRRDLELFNRYTPIGGNFNRFFPPSDVKAFFSPRLVRELKDSGYKNIMVLPENGVAEEISLNELTPERKKQYADFIRSYIGALKGKIAGVELFNEPNLWRHKSGPRKGFKTMLAAKVAELYRIAYPVIKEIDPDMIVAGPCVNGKMVEYTRQFLEAGGGKYIDVFSFHPYCDDPDLYDIAGEIGQVKQLLRKYTGRDLELWNTEQYFGVRNPRIRQHETEYYRQYFRDSELEHAAVIANNLIQHAAAGAKFAMFAPDYFWKNGGRETFPFPAAGAANAAVELLGTAGTGHELHLGEAVKCFVFPKARGGALVTVKAVNAETRGELALPADTEAYDLFGNRISGGTVPVTSVPVYLRMKKGNPDAVMQNALFTGLGEPVSARVTMYGRNSIGVIVANRTNRRERVEVSLLDVPKNWRFGKMRVAEVLSPGESRRILFPLEKSDIRALKEYEFKIGIRTENSYAAEKYRLSALFAAFSKNLSFENAEWNTLGEENLSMNYNGIGEKWNGPQDLGAKFACVWNETGFKLAVTVTDDKFVWPDNAPGAWEQDSIQVYFDMKRNATKEADARNRNMSDDVDYTVSWINGKTPCAYLNRAGGSRFIGEANAVTGIDPEVKVVCRRLSGTQARYEIFFPAAALYDIRFVPGTSFGFSLLVNDNDGKGRKTGLTLAPKGGEPYMKPHLYKDMILEK